MEDSWMIEDQHLDICSSIDLDRFLGVARNIVSHQNLPQSWNIMLLQMLFVRQYGYVVF